MNPLLDFSGLPRFADVRVENIAPAIDTLAAGVRETIDAIATSHDALPSWDTVVAPQFAAMERLDRAWGVVSHLNAVVNSPELREAYNINLQKVTELHAQMSQDSRLHARYRALRAAPAFAQMTPAQQRLVDNELRDFRLGGAELNAADKARFLALSEEQASLMSKFEENVLDATNDFALYIEDERRLAGLPADVLAAAREEAVADGRAGWKLTLHAPSYGPVLQYASDRALREELYRAYTTRASELGKPQWDNGPLIVRLLQLRDQEARMLGFRNFAEVSLTPKMAKSPESAVEFLHKVIARAKPHAERDVATLRDFALKDLGLPDLQAWDIDFASEKLRESRFSFSNNEVKQYFPEDRVFAGMFKVVETIFGLHIRETPAAEWHKDVRLFEIRETEGALVGRFYLDLYARPHKRGGAWMDVAIDRKQEAGVVQTPVATLTCNFSRPVAGKPALFTHSEVTTLFHEFGHGLHLLLTNVEHLGVGMDNVEWDAIELPSQFMENFCWEWEVVRHMSGHVDTGEPLPRELFDKILAAKNFHAGMHFIRQLQLALFDLMLHMSGPVDLQAMWALLRQVRAEVAVFTLPEYNRFPLQFSHIFASAYAAGYYSYLWAEVLSADAFSLFEEMGVMSAEAGRRFRSEILGSGSSRAAEESFVAFRGRPPSIDALFRHNGM
ncbi:MAG: M3 family metallopeptidase [Betaproteobacteria bacterium]